MKITCLQLDLSLALATVLHAVSESSTLPILRDIRLEARAERLSITATDLELTVIYSISATVEEEGQITLPARFFADYIKFLPSAIVTITTHPKESKTGQLRALVKGRSTRSTIRATDATEFPFASEDDGATPVVTIDTTLFKHICEEIWIAASPGSSHNMESGITITKQEDQLHFMATDRYQIAICSLQLSPQEQKQPFAEIHVPATTLKELARVLPDGGNVAITINADQRQVLFHTDMLDIRARLMIHGPGDVRKNLPGAANTRVVANTSELKAIIKSTLPFAPSKRPLFALSVEPGGSDGLEPGLLRLEAETSDVGASMSEIPVAVEGPNQKLYLNAKHLEAYVKAVHAPQIAIEILSARTMVVFTPLHSTSYLYALMPMLPPSV